MFTAPGAHQDPDERNRLFRYPHELRPRLDRRCVRRAECHRSVKREMKIIDEGQTPDRANMLRAQHFPGTGTLALRPFRPRGPRAPPWSRFQYHSPNAITLVSHVTESPMSKARALSVNGNHAQQVAWRSIRPGRRRPVPRPGRPAARGAPGARRQPELPGQRNSHQLKSRGRHGRCSPTATLVGRISLMRIIFVSYYAT
jgi:hypothetical protein